MTIEQMIEVPVNRRISLDLPLELPVGKAKITITPQVDHPNANAYGTIENLRGLAKRMGAAVTMENFLEMRREDVRLEEDKYQRLFHGKGN
ncbi:MAG: hypothetical protein LBU85_07775 [Treponema sp.]|jgi:hypothetical protein|nr:hypothetical protein [Treponema sp.]